MADMMAMLKWIIIIQLFYAGSITLLTYALPSTSLHYVTSFSDLSEDINLESVSQDLESTMTDQLNIPVVELGALIFYSGNIIIDLLLNFFFAIPQMMGLFVNGILLLFNIDSYIFATVQLIASVLITVLYLIGLIQLLINVRSQGRIV